MKDILLLLLSVILSLLTLGIIIEIKEKIFNNYDL